MRGATVAAAAACSFCAACDTDPTVPALAPVIDIVTAAPNPHNVLSAVITVVARQADSVAVVYRPTDRADRNPTLTPAVRPDDALAVVPVLGLQAESLYRLRAVAWGRGGRTESAEAFFETGTLPPDLPSYAAGGPDPSPGYVVFAAGRYGLVIDNGGRVVWYRAFPNGPGLNFVAQPNGRYFARPSTPDPTDVEPWVELDPLGHMTRTLRCASGEQPRLHDLIAGPGGDYWLMCDETRVIDLSASGGAPEARVTGTAVEHVGADGSLLFRWSPFEHFDLTEVDPAALSGSAVNWTHGNSLDLDQESNLVVSFRNLNEVTKIDTRTGNVLWRLSGRGDRMKASGALAPMFARQHGIRFYGPDRILLLDNVGDPGESRVERYVVDGGSATATLAGSWGTGVVTEIGGSVQLLTEGRTLASFGTAGRVVEFDESGRITWSIEGNAGYVFRAQRILSLYAPGVGSSR